MTEKDMRKLNRRELLEMLLYQTRRVEALEKRIVELKAKKSANDIEYGDLNIVLLQIKEDNFRFLEAQKEMLRKTVDICNDVLKEARSLQKKSKNG